MNTGSLPRFPVYSELSLYVASKYSRINFGTFYIVDGRRILITELERHDIRSLRVKYLRTIKAYREDGRPTVYADETYIHSSHTTSYEWDDESGAGLKAPISKGRRPCWQ
jgi:hypothetical protein